MVPGEGSSMPMGVQSQTGQLPGTRDAPAAGTGPLPSEQLLRSDGSDGPFLDGSTTPTWSGELGAPDPLSALVDELAPPDPVAVLVDDASRILLTMTGDLPAATPWGTRRFAREVALVRRHLEPVASPAVLASAFGREAFQSAGAPTTSAGPTRVAYAIRWIELQLDLALPAWGAWLSLPRSPSSRSD